VHAAAVVQDRGHVRQRLLNVLDDLLGVVRRPASLITAAVVAVLVVAFFLLDIQQARVIGIISGSAYGLLALGLVLIYKSSGVFNFAQAEFGTVAVYALYLMKGRAGYLPALVGALLCAIVLGFVVERLIIRPLFDAPRITLLVATAGVALLCVGVEFWIGQAKVRSIGPAVQGNAFVALRQNISWQQVLVVIALLLLGVALALFFNRTTLGLAILGASQEPTASELVGISVRRLSGFTWALAALLGGIAGVLYVPVAGTFGPGALTVGTGTALLIPAFTAAVLGGMTSLPGAFVGGLIVGVAQAAAQSYNGFKGVPGKGSVIVFLLLLGVLIVRPQGLLGSRA
jgi:branched-chain amino acid transport system permease protein